MPKIEIINKDYFIVSLIRFSILFFVLFLVFFIEKKWYKKIIKFLKRKK